MTPCEARSVASTRGDCSVFGAHKMHAMRGRPEIAGRHGAGHAEAVHRPCGFMRGTGRPWPSARRSHPSGRRGTPFGFALAEVLNSLYKAELIRNRPRLDEHGPREGIDAARARHRPVGPLVQHGAPPLRHRHAHPGRARGRPGPRHRPPGTTTTDHHRNQLTEPPQNPGLDTLSSTSDLALARQAPSSGASPAWVVTNRVVLGRFSPAMTARARVSVRVPDEFGPDAPAPLAP